MKANRIAVTSLLLLVLAASAGRAAVTVTLVDGSTRQGESFTLAEGRLALKSADREIGTWSVADVAHVDLGCPDAEADADESGWVYVVGGALRGDVQDFDGKVFTVVSGDVGTVVLPVACVETVVLGKSVPPQVGGVQVARDVVLLSNKDRVSGTLNGMDARGVRFNSDLGDLTLERGRVAAVCVAAPPGGRPPEVVPALKISTAGGASVQLADAETTADAKMSGSLFGGPRVTIPLDRVTAIEVVGGRLAYLDTLEPTEYEQNSLDILKWEIKRGQNVLGQPMLLRDEKGKTARAFTRGLGVHGPCRITYDLAGRYERFIALAGIDESGGQWADANVIVKVDGREVFRADHVGWQQAARRINVDVAGAKRLTLIVESGEHFDVQDRVNWAEARLIRKAEPAPKAG